MKNTRHPPYRARQVAAGKCTRCLARDPRPGKRTCQRCIIIVMAYQARRGARGLCRSCGGELPSDRRTKQLCVECTRVKSIKVADMRERKGVARGMGRPCLTCHELGHVRKTCPQREVAA